MGPLDLQPGDALTVTKPHRLARSTTELLAIEADLSKRGVGLVVLSMGGERLDTRNPTSKLMLTILAGVATWEREIMLERQREGIAKAKAEGKYKGRPPSVDRAKIKTLLACIIRSHPLTLRGHESRSISGCVDMTSCGHFAVVVGRGLGLGWKLTGRVTDGAAAPWFRRSGAANVPVSV